ncbi:MAG: hypothetical protein ACYDHX_05855 [Methanothrix sp.]
MAENYNPTTNDLTTELTERTEDAQRLLKIISWQSPALSSLQAVGSSARFPLDRGCVVWLPAALLAAASGPGRPGLLRCRQGGLDCQASARIRGREARSGLEPGGAGALLLDYMYIQNLLL